MLRNPSLPVNRVPYMIGFNNHDGAATFSVKNYEEGIDQETLVDRMRSALKLLLPVSSLISIFQSFVLCHLLSF